MAGSLKRKLSSESVEKKKGKLKTVSFSTPSELDQPPKPEQSPEPEHHSEPEESPVPELTKEQQQEKLFKNLRLKRIMKENHGGDITQLAFFIHRDRPLGPDITTKFEFWGPLRRPDDSSNMLGTVGGSQFSVYDNENCGYHLDVLSNFNLGANLPAGEDPSKRTLSAHCWFYRKDDSLIATGGADANIHVLSLIYSKEIAIIKGHTKRIVDMQSHPQNDNQFLSISKDGTMRLWDVDTGKCLVIFEYECNVVCFHPSGNTFITGTTKGELREWTIPAYIVPMDDDENDVMRIGKNNSRLLKKMHGDSTIDCIRYVKGNLLTKSINGRMELWDPSDCTSIRSFRVRTGENHCRFDVSLDGAYFCVGTSNGTIYIYNIETGKILAELTHRRATRPVRCCVFSRDTRQVIAGVRDGFLWRYEYVDDETLEKWAKYKK